MEHFTKLAAEQEKLKEELIPFVGKKLLVRGQLSVKTADRSTRVKLEDGTQLHADHVVDNSGAMFPQPGLYCTVLVPEEKAQETPHVLLSHKHVTQDIIPIE